MRISTLRPRLLGLPFDREGQGSDSRGDHMVHYTYVFA